MRRFVLLLVCVAGVFGAVAPAWATDYVVDGYYTDKSLARQDCNAVTGTAAYKGCGSSYGQCSAGDLSKAGVTLGPTDWCGWAYTFSPTTKHFFIALDGGSCPSGQEPDGNGGCAPPPVDCSTRTGEQLSGIATGNPPPSVVGVDGCAYRPCPMGVQVCTATVCSVNYCATGDPLDLQGPSVTDPGPDHPQCVTGESGKEICMDQERPGCGTYNGDPYCAPALPGGQCEFFGSGSFVCDNPDPPLPPNPTAPVDNNGDPMPAADHWQQSDPFDSSGDPGPDVPMSGGGDGSNPAQPNGDGQGDQNGQENGTCTDDPNTPVNECSNLTKIDESGTPGMKPGDVGKAAGNWSGYGDYIDGVGDGAGLPGEGDGLAPVIGWGACSACQPFQVNFMGWSGEFGAHCQFWDNFVKPALAWFFNVCFVIWLLSAWRRTTPSGG